MPVISETQTGLPDPGNEILRKLICQVGSRSGAVRPPGYPNNVNKSLLVLRPIGSFVSPSQSHFGKSGQTDGT